MNSGMEVKKRLRVEMACSSWTKGKGIMMARLWSAKQVCRGDIADTQSETSVSGDTVSRMQQVGAKVHTIGTKHQRQI